MNELKVVEQSIVHVVEQFHCNKQDRHQVTTLNEWFRTIIERTVADADAHDRDRMLTGRLDGLLGLAQHRHAAVADDHQQMKLFRFW